MSTGLEDDAPEVPPKDIEQDQFSYGTIDPPSYDDLAADHGPNSRWACLNQVSTSPANTFAGLADGEAG
jgi:hypothetical protein